MSYYKHGPNENFFADVILKGIVDILLVVTAAILVIVYFGQDVKMSGNSMVGAIESNEVVLINKFSYHFTSPKRYDIILFDKMDSSNRTYGIKRVIGLPGEKVKITEGYIYINDEKIAFNDGKDMIVNAGSASDIIELQDDEYFVIGDNWNNSEDSRFSNIGNIKRNEIIGRVWFRVSPFKKIGIVK